MINLFTIHPVAEAQTVTITNKSFDGLDCVETCSLGDDPDSKRELFLLKTNLHVIIGHDPNLHRSITIKIPAGFVTDFASVPRALQWYAPPKHPDYRIAAIVHDYLYRFGVVDRFVADAIFRDLIARRRPVRRWLMWTAVRAGGKSGYNKAVNRRQVAR